MQHEIDQLRDKCAGLKTAIELLCNAADNGESYELICHRISSLKQLFDELDHEVHLDQIIEAARRVS